MRTFFRSLFLGEPGVDDALADRLAETCERHINRMLVWDANPRPQSTRAPEDGPASDDDRSMTEAGAPWLPTDTKEFVEPSEISPAQSVEPTFDPYAFSVVVILARQGADALKKKLREIDDPSCLIQLADAQHIAIDRSLSGLVELRAAIIAGAKQRLADRRAAAS